LPSQSTMRCHFNKVHSLLNNNSNHQRLVVLTRKICFRLSIKNKEKFPKLHLKS